MDARDPALEARLREEFRGCCFGRNIHAFASCDSTMERAHALAREGAGEGTLVFAARQTQGRGRMGRRWESPEGGAYFSLILRPSRPPPEVPQLSLVAGLSAAETIQEQMTQAAGGELSVSGMSRRPSGHGVPPQAGRARPERRANPGHAGAGGAVRRPPRQALQAGRGTDCEPGPAAGAAVSIRWPNDILIDGKKVAGILTEARNGAVVVGMGINVTTDPRELPETATSIQAVLCPPPLVPRPSLDSAALSAALCRNFGGWYDIWTAQGFAPIRSALLPWLSLGSLVRLTVGDSQVEGQVADVDERGHVVIRLESGVTRVFEVGEVTLLR